MKWPLVTTAIEGEQDVVAVRQRARRLAELLGFKPHDQTRLATAVSEIARNAFGYAGGGRAEFGIDRDGAAQILLIRIIDKGPGIADLPAILEGRYASQTGLGVGITGARRLCDRFEIRSEPGEGTAVTLGKLLPGSRLPLSGPDIAELSAQLARERADDPHTLAREQNRELLLNLSELSEREDEARRLNIELAETNRGVVALYAELEAQAEQLRRAGELLETQVAERTADLARANAELRSEAAERARAEEQLRQAQKMEALGQLTGGIAHDFNNLLTGIVGSLDLMRTRMRQGRPETLERYLKAAMDSAERAGALTHRLLAFARRQPLDPKPVDPNALLASMTDLLRRTLSETIDLVICAKADVWPTLCDPHQLENAILNLTINARDAMPNGGRLTIETSNADADRPCPAADGEIAPGDYVTIRVTDTGTGMEPDVIARAFDPFFTTKSLGQGTGLGLSMVYGFARQSNGHAAIESEVGRGATVSICLPRFQGAMEVSGREIGVDIPHDHAGATVLLVEDEAIVRMLAAEVLADLGFRVLEAVDGPSGLATIRSGERIDLLLTDIGLPGIDGRQLADLARVQRPGLKIIFTTGYAESAALAAGFLGAGMEMITKPYSIEALTKRIGTVMASGQVPDPSSFDTGQTLPSGFSSACENAI